MRIVPTYDRSGLIGESIGTLRRTLIEEAVVVSLVILVFLFHVRSALVPILALPIAVVASFIPMYYLGVTSNIMSLGGLALAIGVLVDASIVMVENAYRHVSEPDTAGRRTRTSRARSSARRSRSAAPIFFSLAIIIVSFVPVFLLEAQEGRMFRPLAFTKTFAMVLRVAALDHARAGADDALHPRPAAAARVGESGLARAAPGSTSRSSGWRCAGSGRRCCSTSPSCR